MVRQNFNKNVKTKKNRKINYIEVFYKRLFVNLLDFFQGNKFWKSNSIQEQYNIFHHFQDTVFVTEVSSLF